MVLSHCVMSPNQIKSVLTDQSSILNRDLSGSVLKCSSVVSGSRTWCCQYDCQKDILVWDSEKKCMKIS